MIRKAQSTDLHALTLLENNSFESDRLSRRSMRHLLARGNATTLVDEEKGIIRGYVLVLYNRGTSLARLYSIVVDAAFRGRGLGLNLLDAAEKDAVENECVIMRLEVRKDNEAAVNLYRRHGYKSFDVVPDYYKDHMEALRFEKYLVPHLPPEMVRIPFYRQTLEFTCGPAALIMAMKALEPGLEIDRKLEIRIWRESTSIFMMSGHGGCGPFGLGLSAFKRGFGVEIYVNGPAAFFVDSVRDPKKKEIIRLVQEDQMEEIQGLPITVHYGVLTVEDIQRQFSAGSIPIVLISSYRIYHEKTPHWVVVTGFDERYIYVHDSFVDSDEGKTEADSINMPILKKDFERMSRYGKAGQKAVIILRGKEGAHVQ
ncbi:MAG: GNAT family N-acetyltransferase/peptidase C39 family protein [Candidatus Eisenbacteria bacterium]